MALTNGQINRMKEMGVTVIHADCSVQDAKNKTLPTTSYLVTCNDGEETWYDIVMGLQVPIFDSYHEVFGRNVIQKMKWTDGNINPKLWGYRNEHKKKK